MITGPVARFLVAALLVAGCSRPTSEREQAFGFWKGMTYVQAYAAAPMTPNGRVRNGYEVTRPPKPEAPFVAYIVVIDPEKGVITVSAVTRGIAARSEEFRETTDLVVADLTRRFGGPEKKEGPLDLWEWKDAQGPGTVVLMVRDVSDEEVGKIVVVYAFSNRGNPDAG